MRSTPGLLIDCQGWKEEWERLMGIVEDIVAVGPTE